MTFTELLSALGSAMVSTFKVVLPGVAESVVDTFNSLAFETNGTTTTMTAVFGWIVCAGALTIGIGLCRAVIRKIAR